MTQTARLLHEVLGVLHLAHFMSNSETERCAQVYNKVQIAITEETNLGASPSNSGVEAIGTKETRPLTKAPGVLPQMTSDSGGSESSDSPVAQNLDNLKVRQFKEAYKITHNSIDELASYLNRGWPECIGNRSIQSFLVSFCDDLVPETLEEVDALLVKMKRDGEPLGTTQAEAKRLMEEVVSSPHPGKPPVTFKHNEFSSATDLTKYVNPKGESQEGKTLGQIAYEEYHDHNYGGKKWLDNSHSEWGRWEDAAQAVADHARSTDPEKAALRNLLRETNNALFSTSSAYRSDIVEIRHRLSQTLAKPNTEDKDETSN